MLGAVVITGLGFAGVYQQSLADQQVLSPQLMADIVTEVEANPIQLPVLSSQLMADIVDGVDANPLTLPRNPLTDYDAEAIIESLQEDNTELTETRMPRVIGGSVIYPVFG